MADKLNETTQKMDNHSGRKTVCECGVEYNSMRVRPLGWKRFFRHGARLADRIEEFDVEFDRRQFFDTLEDLKEQPSNQNQDDELYQQAIDDAVTVPNDGRKRSGSA